MCFRNCNIKSLSFVLGVHKGLLVQGKPCTNKPLWFVNSQDTPLRLLIAILPKSMRLSQLLRFPANIGPMTENLQKNSFKPVILVPCGRDSRKPYGCDLLVDNSALLKLFDPKVNMRIALSFLPSPNTP